MRNRKTKQYETRWLLYLSRRLIRLLYYLPMERMKHTGDYELDEINMLEQECADLEEDNKRLEEENRKLKLELSKLKEKYGDIDF